MHLRQHPPRKRYKRWVVGAFILLGLYYLSILGNAKVSYGEHVRVRLERGKAAFPEFYEVPSVRREITFDAWRTGLWNMKEDVQGRACKIGVPAKPQKSFFPAIKSKVVTGVCQAPKFASLKDGTLEMQCTADNPKYSSQYPGKYLKAEPLVPFPLRDPQSFGGPLQVDAEVVFAQCANDTNLFTQVTPKPDAIDRSRRVLNNLRARKKPPNLVIVLLDTTSRTSFYRRMKHTVDYIQNLGMEQDSKVAVSGVSLGDSHTRITSNNVPQLEVGCPPSPYIKESECRDSTSLSHFMYEQGYVTGASATHRVRVNHYQYQPEENIDRHEDNAFYVQSSEIDGLEGVVHHWNGVPNGEPGGLKWSPFAANLRSHCLFGNFPATYFLNNMKQFLTKYPEDVPKYYWIHILSNHVAEQTGLMDSDELLAQTLSELPLEDTFVLLTSDHGLTYGWSNTPIGVMDHKNPLALLLAPRDYLSEDQESALVYNQHSLITHYDFHVTFKELARANLGSPPPEPEMGFNKKNSNPIFGRSLLSPISADRTCEDAGIAPHWCLCSSTEISADPVLTKKLITSLFSELSEMVRQEEECYDLRHHVDSFALLNGFFSITNNKIYHIIIESTHLTSTSVGTAARFQSWIVVDEETGQLKVEAAGRSSEYSSESCISRLNVPSLAEFCICKDGNSWGKASGIDPTEEGQSPP